MAAKDPFASALDLAAAIRSREVSPVEALDRCLAEVDRLNPTVNAVVWRDDDEARRFAQEAERRVAATDPDLLPPFHGVPMPIKDLTPVTGWPVSYGSHAGPTEASELGEIVVDKLRDAGFVLACRTNTPEFGPITVAENLRYGPTRNPWDPGRTPGGSSGGAGAAVAAGMFPVAHANDGGGSIRIPASCCGLVGLKPSRGRVPRLVQSWQGAVVEGVECWTVADSASVLDAISGPDRLAWYNAPPPERPFADEVGADQPPLRIGLVETVPLGLPLDEACADAAGVAASLLADLGHRVEPVVFDTLPEDLIAMAMPVIWAGYVDYPGVDWERTEPHNAQAYRNAADAGLLDLAQSIQGLQLRTRKIVAHWGRDFDVLLTPTLSIEPPPVGTVLEAVHASPGEPALPVIQMVAFTIFGNLTGLPAISLPLHATPSGLPIGVQLTGGPWDEATLIRLAAQLEQAAPWAGRRPDVDRLAAAA
ncbi:MAG: amidase [Solirubrobacteraceae bacterium]